MPLGDLITSLSLWEESVIIFLGNWSLQMMLLFIYLFFLMWAIESQASLDSSMPCHQISSLLSAYVHVAVKASCSLVPSSHPVATLQSVLCIVSTEAGLLFFFVFDIRFLCVAVLELVP